jgi:hypothetical protein
MENFFSLSSSEVHFQWAWPPQNYSAIFLPSLSHWYFLFYFLFCIELQHRYLRRSLFSKSASFLHTPPNPAERLPPPPPAAPAGRKSPSSRCLARPCILLKKLHVAVRLRRRVTNRKPRSAAALTWIDLCLLLLLVLGFGPVRFSSIPAWRTAAPYMRPLAENRVAVGTEIDALEK